MSDQLLKDASEMFKSANQWNAACKLADLIPDIKTFWFEEFMDLLSDNIASNLKKDKRFDAFQIMPWSKDYEDRYWYIMPKDANCETDEKGQPLGLSTAIQITIVEDNEFELDFGLSHFYKNKKAPALPKMEKFFTQGLRAVLSDFKPAPGTNDWNCNDWNENGWVIWENLCPEGKNVDLSEPETIYYLHENGQEFIDTIIEKILIFVSKHRDALISAHTKSIEKDFE